MSKLAVIILWTVIRHDMSSSCIWLKRTVYTCLLFSLTVLQSCQMCELMNDAHVNSHLEQLDVFPAGSPRSASAFAPEASFPLVHSVSSAT